MEQMGKILVAIDFSDYSLPTLRYALSLADRTGAEVVAVNVINERDVQAIRSVKHMVLDLDEKEFIITQKANRDQKLEELIRGAACSRVRVQKMFRVGVPAAEILAAIGETGADLVVIGTKGRTNLAGLLFGSTAEKVFRRSPVSVLSVRGEEHAALVCRMNEPLTKS
jgi:nucleotide-binding universal stress UspA family protein